MKKWRPLDPYSYSDATAGAGFLAEDINQRMAELFPGEPKPEPATEDPQDYSCPICGKSTNFNYEPICQHTQAESTAAANRRIAQLTRERDEWENECKVQIRQAEAERDGIRAQTIQDTKDAAVKALETRQCGANYVPFGLAMNLIRNLEVK